MMSKKFVPCEKKRILWKKEKSQKEKYKHCQTERIMRYSDSSRRTGRLRRRWGWCCSRVWNDVLCRKTSSSKHWLLTKLPRTEHHLETNGGNTIYNNKHKSRARRDNGRIRWKLVNLKNSSVVALIGCVRRCQLNISLTKILPKKRSLHLEQHFHQSGQTMAWVANPVRIITTFAVLTFWTSPKRSAELKVTMKFGPPYDNCERRPCGWGRRWL